MLTSVATDATGNVYAAGATDSPRGVDFGGGPIGGGADAPGGPFFVEITNAGEHVVCSRSYPGGRTNIPDATIQFAGAGGSFVATLDLGKGPMTSNGGYDLWLADFAR